MAPFAPAESMRRLPALSGDGPLLERLRGAGLRGRVHSVFERTINVEDAAAGLVTLASRDVDDAPDTLVLDATGLGSLGVRAGDEVRPWQGELRIGDRVRVPFDAAHAWRPAALAYPADDARLRRNLQLVRARRAIRSMSWGPTLAAASMRRSVGALCDALGREDPAAVVALARELIGLGQGLTPSGDDFLLGLFSVLHVPGSPCGRFRRICGDAVADVETRTPAISAAALRAAANGRVRESIRVLLREIMGGTPAALDTALERVLALGATSGADIVGGIEAGFDLNLRLAPWAPPPSCPAA